MVVINCFRIVFRRLTPRKAVVITIVCLSLLALSLLYRKSFGSGDTTSLGPRKIHVPLLANSPSLGSQAALPNSNISYLDNENRPLETKLPNSWVEEEAGFQNELQVISSQLPECIFSSTQPIANHVDIQVSEVMDQLAFDNPRAPGGWMQGFDISYAMSDFQQDQLQVFIIPHSHNDPGWLKTFEDYYHKQTRQILNVMTDSLIADKRKKFIWAEISYLDLWWQEQSHERRQQFKQLVENGQLEIVTGGWVMNDEANTHYFSMLDQLIEGHVWLQKNLPGVTPTTGWAIDPFGYTSTMAYLLQGVGVESMLIQRVHYAVKKQLALSKQLEFGWLQQWDQGYDTGILCHMMPFYSYDVPHTCGPDPKVCCQFDFLRLPGGRVKCPWRVSPQVITDENVKERAEMLADQYRKKSRLYRTNILLVPLGDDFRWETKKEFDQQFSNYYKLLDYMNSHSDMKINAQFGTLADYFDTLRKSVPLNRLNKGLLHGFPLLTGDFFTYADRVDHYWSGYYTSRPYHKNMDRVLQTNLRAAEVFYSLVIARKLPLDGTRKNVPSLLTDARRNLGLFQHHDGITGTAKDPVVVDYARRVTTSITVTKGILSDSVKALTIANAPSHLTGHLQKMTFEPYEKVRLPLPVLHEVIKVQQGPKVTTFVNPLTQAVKQLVTVTVDLASVTVMDWKNKSIPCQISPIFEPKTNHISSSLFNLSFIATLPPLGFSHYTVSVSERKFSCVAAHVQLMNMEPIESVHFNTEHSNSPEDFVLSNDYNLEAKFSAATGLLKSLSNGPTEVKVDMDFVMYGTATGKDKSGAYLFLPGGEAKSVTSGWAKPPVTITIGPLLQEVRTTLDSGLVTHAVQLINSPGVDGKSVAISNLVDITKESNKEVAMRFHSSIDNADSTFYTDENGFQMIRRKTLSKIPLQGNFYPMPTSAVVQDDNSRISLLSGQPLGVASLKKGWLEVILDRRLMQDDNRGVGQGVKDSVVTLEPFRLLVERRLGVISPTAALMYPSLLSHASLDSLLHPIQTLVSDHPSSVFLTPYTPLTDPFPCDLHLVNLRSLMVSTQDLPSSALILHRRGFECGFDIAPLHCRLVNGELQLSNLFTKSHTISMATQTSLSLLHEKAVLEPVSGFRTQITPMQIHTYKITW